MEDTSFKIQLWKMVELNKKLYFITANVNQQACTIKGGPLKGDLAIFKELNFLLMCYELKGAVHK